MILLTKCSFGTQPKDGISGKEGISDDDIAGDECTHIHLSSSSRDSLSNIGSGFYFSISSCVISLRVTAHLTNVLIHEQAVAENLRSTSKRDRWAFNFLLLRRHCDHATHEYKEGIFAPQVERRTASVKGVSCTQVPNMRKVGQAGWRW